MATENGHDHAHPKMAMPDGSLAGFDTLDALFQVIQCLNTTRPSQIRAACPATLVQLLRKVITISVSAVRPPSPPPAVT